MSAVTRAWRASFVSCTIHGRSAAPPAVVADEEVGEARRSRVGRERRLVDDLGVGGERRVRPSDRIGEGDGIRRSRLGDLDHAVAVPRDVVGEHAALVHGAEAPRALEGEVFGLFDRRDAPEPRVDRTQPGELALGGRLEIARAPDDPAFVLDVSHASPSLTTLAAASDTSPRSAPSPGPPGNEAGEVRIPAGMPAAPARLERMSLPFESAYRHGFARVAACTIPVSIADPAANAEAVLAAARECDADAVAVAVFPELCLTGYAIDDLVMQDAVLDAVESPRSSGWSRHPRIFSRCSSSARRCATATASTTARVVIHRGELLGVAPKSYLPTYREFYERRWYAPGDDQGDQDIRVGALEAPFGPDLLFEALDVPGLVVHAEVCEDVWVPIPPSSRAALAGATVLLNLSGSPITIARAEDRKDLCQSQSLRCLAAYAYAAAGRGESTNDVSWDGQTMIYEGGNLLAETERFPDGPRRSVADVDLDRLRQDRLRQGTFDDNRRTTHADAAFRTVHFELDPPATDVGLRRTLDRFPFVPDDPARLAQDCYEAFNIQVSGLVQRMRAIGGPKPVIGVSGGLDSTHALLVVARAMDRMGRPRSDILAYTMPGFATSEHTKSNAIALAEAVGASIETIDIRPPRSRCSSASDHPFADGEPVHDITFENVQAGLRTDYLFRLANQHGGMVIGTSDLSELALGWATYGVGDQMSHYAVNTGVPKTLIQHVIRWVISHRGDEGGSTELSDRARDVLQSVLDTEIIARARARRPGRQDPVDRGPHRPVRPARLHALPRAAVRLPPVEDRVPRRARVGRPRMPARGRPGSPTRTATRTTCRRSRSGCGCSCSATSRSRSSSARRSRTARRCRRRARCRRAATGARRPTATRARGSPSSKAALPEARRG